MDSRLSLFAFQYHSLLPAKLHRALCGFHEPAVEGDISLYDAVAQFQVCKKAIGESIKALRNIAEKKKELQDKITQLLALLYNILGEFNFLKKVYNLLWAGNSGAEGYITSILWNAIES